MEEQTQQKFEVDYSLLRKKIRDVRTMSERDALKCLRSSEQTRLDHRNKFQTKTASLIKELRSSSQPDLLSLFVSEYNLTSDEGLSLMTLVEAFLRVPDNKTRDKLFIDKIARKGWSIDGEYSHYSSKYCRQFDCSWKQ